MFYCGREIYKGFNEKSMEVICLVYYHSSCDSYSSVLAYFSTFRSAINRCGVAIH